MGATNRSFPFPLPFLKVAHLEPPCGSPLMEKAMARLFTADGRQEDRPEAVIAAAAALGLHLRHLPLPAEPLLQRHLAASSLSPAEQEELLTHLDQHLGAAVQAPAEAGRDLVLLDRDTPKLEELRQQFARLHTHADDEVRYILEGVGYFGIVLGDGEQILLETGPGDYLEVPAGTEHWFALGANPRLKALRVFHQQQSWSADYTGRSAHPRLAALPLA